MKAAVFYEPGEPLVIEDLSVDKPRPREVLVRVAASGLCHSDLHIMLGDLPCPRPLVLGHEAAGIVEQVGSEVTALKVGDHVVCCPSVFCGACEPCLSGHSNRCTDRPGRKGDDPSSLSLVRKTRVLVQHGSIGAFAEQMLVHEHAVVKIPRGLPLDRAALLGCAVVTGLGAVFNAARVHPGSTVVVVGCGGVGLSVVQGARIAGSSQIIAVDRAPEKLELARKLGATDLVRGGDDAVLAVKELSRGGVEYAFEAIGLPKTIEQAIQMLGGGGLLTILGATRIDATVALPTFPLMWGEQRIQGSRLGSGPFRRDIPRIAALYADGRLDLDTLVSERIALAEINRGYETMKTGNQARSIIVFDDVMRDAAHA